ncbi:MAG: NUDIX domain-containing protein [Acidobacteriota bacterium]
MKTELQFSAGGVIFRKTNNTVEIALISPKENIWCLPKGIVNKGEKPEEAAKREIKEETGLEGRLIDKIDKIEYWYVDKKNLIRYHKFVYFFLYEFENGDIKNHDWEVIDVKWFSTGEIFNFMSYKNEKEIVKKAIEIINKI